MAKILTLDPIVSGGVLRNNTLGNKALCNKQTSTEASVSASRASTKAYAEHLIREASGILKELGENERRVSWLLTDCVELLERTPVSRMSR